MIKYDYVIVGAGIAGCSMAYFLKDKNVLLIDKNEDLAFGASGAAGAFLSPLMGKKNALKDLVSKSLKFSLNFYKELLNDKSLSKGVLRIPKNNEDEKKFEEYKPYMDFAYLQKEQGLFFDVGAHLIPKDICKLLTQDVDKKLSYEIKHINYKNDLWQINDEIQAKKLILCTGANTKLIEEKYFNIRAVWGQKIDIHSTTCIDINYHKECSLSASIKLEEKLNGKTLYKNSIGATHHRFTCDKDICNYCIETSNINNKISNTYTNDMNKSDTKELLLKAKDIKSLEDVKVVDIKVGARASSFDYFPMVGKLIDSKKTLSMFPHLKNGTHVKEERFSTYDNLFVINGLGGRGFVLSPYLAKNLSELIKNNIPLEEEINVNRLFKRWVRKEK